MLLNLKKLFSEQNGTLSFEDTFSLTEIAFHQVHPFSSPIILNGKIEAHSGFLKLEATAEYTLTVPCDRCLSMITEHHKSDFSHVLINESAQHEEEEAFVVVKDETLDVTALIREDLLLSLPHKFLCKEDCRGLCPKCGKNLNDGPCDCDFHQTDPRLEVLKQLID